MPQPNDIPRIKAALVTNLPSLLPALFREKRITQEPTGWRVGSNGSLSVRQDGCWYCHESGSGGDVLDLVAFALATDFKGALAWAKAYTGGRETVVAQRVEQRRPDYSQAKHAHAAKQSAKARNIWRQAQVPIGGTA